MIIPPVFRFPIAGIYSAPAHASSLARAPAMARTGSIFPLSAPARPMS